MAFGIIFDMDGVLVDSPKFSFAALNKVLSAHNVNISMRDKKNYLGRPLEKIINDLHPHLNPHFNEISKQTWLQEKVFIKETGQNKPALMHLLKEIKKQKIPICVGTSSPLWRAKEILKILKIQKFFNQMVTGEDVQNHKPHPDVFLTAAKKLKLTPKQCIVIEDAHSGIEAAQRAGMKVIAIATEFNSKKELSHADLVIEDFSELSIEKIKALLN